MNRSVRGLILGVGMIGLGGLSGALGGTIGCSSSSDAGGGHAGPDAGNTVPSDTNCQARVTHGALGGKAAGATCEYLGIRYAKPPVGDLRFAPPQPADPWTGTLGATKFGNACVQATALGTTANGGVASSEDCLFLNVYAPKATPAKALPVMVFLHGGGFTIGAGSQYDGQALAEKGGTVVVTLNYRLGALGYFASPGLDSSRAGVPAGSDGIRDQQLAIQWVKDNVAVFHGDAANVTVFGESAGSLSTCIHVVSPGSQGLAQHFIMESGSCVGPVSLVGTKQDRYDLSGQLVDALCPGAGDGGTGELACLRALDANKIMTWLPTAPPVAGSLSSLTGNLLGAPFFPVVEGAGGVLPDLPANLIKAGTYAKDAQIIAGTNAHEFGLFVYLGSLGLAGMSNLSFPTKASLDAAIDNVFGANAGKVKMQYDPADDAGAQDAFTAMVTDYAFRCPTRDFARLATAHGSKSVYLYSYDYGRAYHSDELPALFSVTGLSLLGATVPTPGLADAIKGYWSRLATAGDPNGAGAVAWPAYDAVGDSHLVLTDPAVAGTHLDRANCDFWDALSGFTSP